ncbi:MAG: hypothetical protein COA79_22970 [Planctomycetota bacterium]|nr:MAG: hypothetical protein COA79_22970 [Planctomycetota bacterium]
MKKIIILLMFLLPNLLIADDYLKQKDAIRVYLKKNHIVAYNLCLKEKYNNWLILYSTIGGIKKTEVERFQYGEYDGVKFDTSILISPKRYIPFQMNVVRDFIDDLNKKNVKLNLDEIYTKAMYMNNYSLILDKKLSDNEYFELYKIESKKSFEYIVTKFNGKDTIMTLLYYQFTFCSRIRLINKNYLKDLINNYLYPKLKDDELKIRFFVSTIRFVDYNKNTRKILIKSASKLKLVKKENDDPVSFDVAISVLNELFERFNESRSGQHVIIKNKSDFITFVNSYKYIQFKDPVKFYPSKLELKKKKINDRP